MMRNHALVRNQLHEKSLLLQKWAQKQNFFNVWPIKGGYYAWVTWEGKKMTAEIASEAVAKGLGVAPSWLFGRGDEWDKDQFQQT